MTKKNLKSPVKEPWRVTVGQLVRSSLPAGMMIKDAAAHAGVGRAALSYVVNGQHGLSVELAARLDDAFNIDGANLLLAQTMAEYGEFRKKHGRIVERYDSEV